MKSFRLYGSVLAVSLAALTLTSCGPEDSGPVTQGGPLGVRRLTEEQYRASIADIFGSDIKVAGRFEPEVRHNGLLAVGSSAVTISPAGFEQYDTMARNIAAQVMDDKHRNAVMPCQPQTALPADRDACTAEFVAKVGEKLFRRPLTKEEIQRRVDASELAAKTFGYAYVPSFNAGVQAALTDLLEAPEFLFRIDQAVADPAHQGAQKLDAYSKATRLSFLLWNTTPDEELLNAAAKGELDTKEGLTKQVDRLMASPRLEVGVRAFFADMLQFDKFGDLAKDQVVFPKFSQRVLTDAQEQTLMTLTDLLLKNHGDYRDVFTTRKTFMTPTLGMVYGVPVAARDGWVPYEFPEGDLRAGLITEVSFMSLYGHPGRSSATLRGKFVRENLLCQKVPDPPSNVDFTVVQDTSNPKFKTARDRVTAHRTSPACAGCHKIMDPIGLALENFDGLGQERMTENGVTIDASGELDGAKFKDPVELGKVMHDNASATSCLVDSVYRYAVGRVADPGEKEWVGWLKKSFADQGYKFPELLRRVATSDAFYQVQGPAAKAPTTAATDGANSHQEGKS